MKTTTYLKKSKNVEITILNIVYHKTYLKIVMLVIHDLNPTISKLTEVGLSTG